MAKYCLGDMVVEISGSDEYVERMLGKRGYSLMEEEVAAPKRRRSPRPSPFPATST